MLKELWLVSFYPLRLSDKPPCWGDLLNDIVSIFLHLMCFVTVSHWVERKHHCILAGEMRITHIAVKSTRMFEEILWISFFCNVPTVYNFQCNLLYQQNTETEFCRVVLLALSPLASCLSLPCWDDQKSFYFEGFVWSGKFINISKNLKLYVHLAYMHMQTHAHEHTHNSALVVLKIVPHNTFS